ncbi:MAG: thioredoxin family protein [Phyllobacteriaceae bacterium]|nr:thioredoxin family protein [Phyllobacteriaceae bacterium]
MISRRSFLAGSTLALSALSLPAMAETRKEADAVNFESIDQIKAIAEREPAILYFHAEWCPTCRATMVSFRGRWPEIQPGITLVIADYDTEEELKAKYGVTYQNTYVQVGRDGEKVQIWNGGGIDALNTKPLFDY